MDMEALNSNLEKKYDSDFYNKLQIVTDEISLKSKALASNLKECIDRLRDSDRYLRAFQGLPVATKDSDLDCDEFEIFRKYVRLLRSCTIMCGQETSRKFKELFIDFFSGTRLELAKQLGDETRKSK